MNKWIYLVFGLAFLLAFARGVDVFLKHKANLRAQEEYAARELASIEALRIRAERNEALRLEEEAKKKAQKEAENNCVAGVFVGGLIAIGTGNPMSLLDVLPSCQGYIANNL